MYLLLEETQAPNHIKVPGAEGEASGTQAPPLARFGRNSKPVGSAP